MDSTSLWEWITFWTHFLGKLRHICVSLASHFVVRSPSFSGMCHDPRFPWDWFRGERGLEKSLPPAVHRWGSAYMYVFFARHRVSSYNAGWGRVHFISQSHSWLVEYLGGAVTLGCSPPVIILRRAGQPLPLGRVGAHTAQHLPHHSRGTVLHRGWPSLPFVAYSAYAVLHLTKKKSTLFCSCVSLRGNERPQGLHALSSCPIHLWHLPGPCWAFVFVIFTRLGIYNWPRP